MVAQEPCENLTLWGAEGVKRNLDPRNWPQNREVTLEGGEVWRLDKASQTSTESLCALCRTVDFRCLLSRKLVDNRDEVPYGYLEDVVARTKSCAFCRLLVKTLQHFTGLERLPMAIGGSRVKCDLRQFVAGMMDGYLCRAIWVATVPPLPCRIEGEGSSLSTVNNPSPSPVARPMDTPVPYSMLGEPSGPCPHIWDERDLLSDEPSPGEIVPRRVDFEKVSFWLGTCEGCSKEMKTLDPPPGFLLIDTIRNCLVEDIPAGFRYAALSYTWGRLSRPYLVALRSNVAELKVPGALSPENPLLPATVRDAIIVAQKCRERYLWVDALCIVQDDVERKIVQMKAMTEIYSSAAFTIVAAHGSDADAGLPGISCHRRYQHSEEVQGCVLVNRLFTTREVLDSSWWNTRAWTYQERVLSSRLLVFADSQIHLTCLHSTYREDETIDLRYTKMLKKDSVWESLVEVWSSYCGGVINYSIRNLTFDDDGLNGFMGFANALKARFRSGFALGLPVSYFDTALLWYSRDTPRRRRDRRARPILPSWTWAAWAGSSAYGYGYPLSSRVLIRNFYGDGAGYTCAEQLLPPADWAEWDEWERSKSGSVWTHKRESKISGRYPVLAERERPNVIYAHPDTGHLEFWTQVAYFKLDRSTPPPGELDPGSPLDLTEPYTTGTWLVVRDAGGKAVGVINLNVALETVDLGALQPLILLSRTTRDRHVTHGPEEYHFAPSSSSSSSSDADAESNDGNELGWDQRQFEYDKTHPEAARRPPSGGGPDGKGPGRAWNVYNVMLLDGLGGVSTRYGVGLMWLASFHDAGSERVHVTLG
ncbi:heterokaryon incompatibility protein-domain-containing protein [Xylariomycetidae sp. FL2044]|nr:heterokaryon incompatibility protein-domain-containing protein [Xylariomycetidae sp. FL2044]